MSAYPFPKAVDFADLSKTARARIDFGPGWGLQSKLDGCALIYEQPPGRGTPGRLMSGSGKPVLSCDHIAAEIRACLSDWHDGFTVAMEVWRPELPFQEISGAFRRHSPQPHLRYTVFDGFLGGHHSAPYEDRMHSLGSVTKVFSLPAVSEDNCWRTAHVFKDAGDCDGAILRDLRAPWEAGRSKGSIIKLKPLLEYDLLVTGFEEAVGEKTGRKTGALLCRWRGASPQKVATGLSHAQQENLGQFVGKVVAVEAMGLTEDGYLREPRFRGERDDKISPDF